MINCLYCKQRLSGNRKKLSHEKRCLLNSQRVPRLAWNSGKKTGITWNRGIKGSTSGRASSVEGELLRKQRISEAAKLRSSRGEFGGYVQGSGRGKKGWYKNIFCDSSWELALVLFCLDNGQKIERCTETRKYTWKGKQRLYRPDFIVDGRLIEVKGYKTPQSELKSKLNSDIEVWDKHKMKPVLQYVTNKFGKDFVSLYDLGRG